MSTPIGVTIIPTNGTSPLYGIPFNVVHGNTTAKINVTIDNYPGESDIVPVPIPPNAVIEGDYQNGPNPNGAGYNTGQRGDSHLIVWDEDNNIGYELFGVSRPVRPGHHSMEFLIPTARGTRPRKPSGTLTRTASASSVRRPRTPRDYRSWQAWPGPMRGWLRRKEVRAPSTTPCA